MTNDALTKVKNWVMLLVWKVTVQKAEQKGEYWREGGYRYPSGKLAG